MELNADNILVVWRKIHMTTGICCSFRTAGKIGFAFWLQFKECLNHAVLMTSLVWVVKIEGIFFPIGCLHAVYIGVPF